ncbi:MAG TPA: hypothetical protein VK789_34050 [Bryobacteraceae bacterium]|nr:hypothetical protein [Bryobacteraceae bacterium]
MIFLSQSIEYAGAEYMKFAGLLALGGGLGTIAALILAARMFKHVGDGDVGLAICCCAGLPFAVGWLLSINGTQVNVHGFAILGLIFYALGCWACVIALIIAMAVRSRKRREA